jgi:uncharacterized protein with von Willebrand factor type A (vWA) domain
VLRSLTDFVAELRAIGIPVSLVEAVDAAAALREVDLKSREQVRSALAATLVKADRHAAPFDIAFDVFFDRQVPGPDTDDLEIEATSPPGGSQGGGGAGSGDDATAMADAIARALQSGDIATLRQLVRRAVDHYAGMEAGRPVGGRYYHYRVMRQIDAERIGDELLAAALTGVGDGDEMTARMSRNAVAEAMESLDTELRREIVRRLVADRGPESVARTLRSPLVEDLDLMQATRVDLERIERAITPLARKLATRLARRRRHRVGRLDVRRTIRRSLSHGGALLYPRFTAPHRSKPELVLLCDVSGSMATFARFTMHLTYAVGTQFSRVRTFAFIDGLDEVTDYLSPAHDFLEAMGRMSAEAQLVWQDGHSDYGSSLAMLAARYPDAVTERSTVVIAGDARNNYRDPRVSLFSEMFRPARAVFWMNPEARRYWNTGDSDLQAYEPHCDAVFEVRTLRQLEAFVEAVAIPVGVRSTRRMAAAGGL